MSAIALPLIHTTAADNEVLGVSPTVNIENLKDISPVDIPAFENAPARYQIIFTELNTDNQIKKVTWSFSVKATRDAKFAAVVALASTAV